MKRRSFLAGLGALAATDALAYEPADWAQVMDSDPGDLDHWIPNAQIQGRIPPELLGGEFLVNGPAHLLVGGQRMHPFDGHGYVRGWRFTETGVQLRARFVKTPALEREQEQLVYRGLGTNPHRRARQNRKAPADKNAANTTLYHWNGSLYAGFEAMAPTRLDPVTLDTLGEEPFVPGAVLAHVRRVGDRLMGLSLGLGMETQLRWFELEGDQVVQEQTFTEGPIFCHDFAATERYAVLCENPLSFRMGKLLMGLRGHNTVMEALEADTSRPGTWKLYPRDGGAPITLDAGRPCFVVHYAGAVDLPDGRVQVDACTFDDLRFGNEFGFTPDGWDPVSAESNPSQRLMRWILDPATGRAEATEIHPTVIDFPQFRGDEVIGAARSHERAFPFDSVARLDAGDPGRPPELYVSQGFMGEPLYAGERHIVVCVYGAQRSEIHVLERDNLAGGPVAVVPSPVLPYGFHGVWSPHA